MAAIAHLQKLPNQITLLRLLLVPVLWALALLELKFPFAIVLIIAGLTDTFDGVLARKLKQTSEFGAKFDSLADSVLGASIVFWFWLFFPTFFKQNLLLIAFVLCLFLLNLFLGHVKYRTFIHYHLYSDKITTVVNYIFGAHALLFGISQVFFYATIGLTVISLAEEIAMTLTHREFTDTQSIFGKT